MLLQGNDYTEQFLHGFSELGAHFFDHLLFIPLIKIQIFISKIIKFLKQLTFFIFPVSYSINSHGIYINPTEFYAFIK